jgi:hypothetical protein
MSFIHEEEGAARAVHNFIRKILGNSIDTFRSSDETAIYAGEEWMARIFEELKTAKVLISMLSPISVGRPWINFEAGAAWMGSSKVIPVCFNGLTIGELPKPYSSLQAVEINTHEGAYYFVSSIAHHLNVEKPKKPLFDPSEHLLKYTEIDPEENKKAQMPYKMLNYLLKRDYEKTTESA